MVGYRIGVDIGGTCTDCVVVAPSGATTLAKSFSTPPEFSQGIMDSLGEAAGVLGLSTGELLARTDLFLHSTTIAENAIVDGDLAKTGLLTTRGFAGTLWATRGGYGRWSGLTEEEKRDPINTDKPAPIVPLTLVREIRERVASPAGMLVPLRPDEVAEAVRELRAEGVDAIGVCFLWSFLDPSNELAARAVIRQIAPELFVSISSEVAPTIGEYERTSTTAISAAVGPRVRMYLETLERRLREQGFGGTLLVMQAHGGLQGRERAQERPAALIESGPVSGLIGCARLGQALGTDNIISTDMGGTTFKVGTIRNGQIEYQRDSTVLRYHLSIPKLDVASFGLAGGSIIGIDPQSSVPTVGPRSAGSYPGPVCYGHGGREPTVTDVDAILGYLDPRFFLGGRASIDAAGARAVFGEKVADPLGLPVEEAAAALYRLTNSLIYDFLHRTTVQRGLDPRAFALFSTGGTAGMHLPAVAAQLGIPTVVAPNAASVYGAYGLVTSDVVDEELVTRPMRHPADPAAVRALFADLTDQVLTRLGSVAGLGAERIAEWLVDLRFRRQVHILTVRLAQGPAEAMPSLDVAALEQLVERFETLYRERYGAESAYRDAGVELVTFRVRCSIPTRVTTISEPERPGDAHDAFLSLRRAYDPALDRFSELSCYDFQRLSPGDAIGGPAIVWSPITTIVVTGAQRARLDGWRNLIIEGREAAR